MRRADEVAKARNIAFKRMRRQRDRTHGKPAPVDGRYNCGRCGNPGHNRRTCEHQRPA